MFAPDRQWKILAAGLCAIVCCVFTNTLANSFVWDDEQFVATNAYLTSPNYLPKLVTQNIVAGAGLRSNLYRPVQSLTHFLDVRLWRYRPLGHHLTNILLHAAAMAALFAWLSTLVPLPAAFVAALLYAIHPLQSEAVAYVSGRGDTLALLWLFLGLVLYRRGSWWALLCAALAVGSKESLVLFPIFLGLDHLARGERIAWRRVAPFVALSAVYVLARLTLLNFQNTLNFYGTSNILSEHPAYRLWTYLTTLPMGLRLWLWPSDLHHERAWSVYASFAILRVWLSALGIAAWIGLIAWTWRRARMAAAAMIWCLIATLPTSNLVAIINALFYDHWFLLPGVGLAWLAAQAPWFADSRRQKVAVCVGCAIAVALAWQTWRYNAVWRTGKSLNAHLLHYAPENPKLLNNYAMQLTEDSELDESARLYRRAIEISDEYPQTHYNLARVELQRGRAADAAAEFKHALAIDPRFYQAHEALGMLALQHGRWADAEREFRQALEIYPYAPEAQRGLAELERRR